MSDEKKNVLLEDAIKAFKDKLEKSGGSSHKFDGKEKKNEDKWDRAIKDLQRKR